MFPVHPSKGMTAQLVFYVATQLLDTEQHMTFWQRNQFFFCFFFFPFFPPSFHNRPADFVYVTQCDCESLMGHQKSSLGM